ncbi:MULTISPECIES: AMP-binding protein [unclassified Pseudomonas]|jgi:amino acid adenylation domain-containing protein|uniref:AMP-binding protein n=1 Tax=unclassified Pseudomonas TaxID=196821 RepID=UPI001AE784C6|nr:MULTISPECIES: AMP-binding protein [unclassified Pseudomonas]MBP1123967.1 amino acid adenylation domain-containing protein [Pseudomonas sp. PvP025]MDQ0397827.1 amino acid adenylation domain-containing protein [Pseudomonas sp. PvP006]
MQLRAPTTSLRKNLKVAYCNATEVAGDLVAAGLELWSEGGRLRYAGPVGALSDELKARAAQVRGALVERLAQGDRLAPPSRAQQRIYAAHAMGGEGDNYLVPLAWRMDGALEAGRVLECVSTLVKRHEVLRQGFVRFGKYLVSVVSAQAEVDFAALSVICLPGQDLSVAIRSWIEEESARPLDVARSAMFRVRLVTARDGSCYLLWVLHHLICDEWSSAQLLQEFVVLYSAGAEALPAPVAYRDYVQWEHLQTRERSPLLDKCVERLELATGETSTPSRPHSQAGDNRTALARLDLTPAASTAVANAARAMKVSEFVFLLSAFVMLQARYSRSRNTGLVTPVTARLDERFMNVVGPVQQLAIISSTVGPDRTFSSLCASITRQVNDAFSPEYPPMEHILAEHSARKGGVRTELPGTLFVMAGPAMNLSLGNVQGVSMSLRNREAKTNLLACAARSEGVLQLAFEYRPASLEAAIARQMLDEYASLLPLCAQDTSICERLVEAATVRRQAQMPVALAAREGNVLQWFDETVLRNPDAAAVTGAQYFSYRQLAGLVNHISVGLPASVVNRGACVAVWGRLSARMIATLLGVMRAGACVVPFDADMPEQRVVMICQRDGIDLLIVCDPALARPGIECAVGVPVMLPDELAWDGVDPAPLEHCPTLHVDSLAYVMYTSGSSGEPKGVSVSHRAFSRFVEWASAAFAFNELAAFNVLTHASFDVSLFEVFAPLVTGCPLHIDAGQTYLERLRASATGAIAAVPSVLRSALAAGISLKAATHLFVAGEAFSPALATLLAAQVPHAQVWNLYGPTEAVVYTSIHKIAAGGPVPIGVPRDGLACYVLRDDWTLLPNGALGELAIGGHIAREYLGMPALTAARFVPDPFTAHAAGRMYLTGDLVFVDGHGILHYVGRRDRQLKNMGVRLEPEEVERVLLDHPLVTAACVCMGQDDAQLVAFVEADIASVQEHDLRRHCYERLPRAMTPQRFVLSPALQRTPAGKLDVTALRARLAHLAAQPLTGLQPAGATQTLLMGLWAEVLGHTRFDIRTNFFEAGGNSLLLLALFDRLPGNSAEPLSVVDLFNYTTVEQLAGRLDQSSRSIRHDMPSSSVKNYKTALRRHKVKYGNDKSV